MSYVAPYVWPVVRRILTKHPGRRVFKIGCGDGTFAIMLEDLGYEVTGIDPAPRGIKPGLHKGSVYDDLSSYGTFPIVISLEVIEHLFDPRALARSMFAMLEPGGLGVISTPYHGYWKNLALSLAGKWDSHFTALWDGGHIKFFSVQTLTTLLNEAAFQDVTIYRAGRIPPFAKTMIAVVRKL